MTTPSYPQGGPGTADPVAQQPKTSALAIVALVLACLFFLPVVPFIGGILGIVALVRINSRPQLGGMGIAIAAIPVGFVVGFLFTGVLAAIAIPAFINYVRKSKAVEVRLSLDQISSGARLYASEPRGGAGLSPQGPRFPIGSTGWGPEVPCCEQPGKRCQSSGSWNQAPWTELGFQPAQPHYFQYQYNSRGPRFAVEARADLDCDGTYSSHTLTGWITPDGNVEFGPRNPVRPLE